MSRALLLARAQAAAERGMEDACVVQRRTGESVGAGGVITPTYVTLYTGKCRVRTLAESGQRDDVGEASRVIVRRQVQLPVSVTGLKPDDRITIATSLDPELVGRVFAIREVIGQTNVSARRCEVIEATS